MTARAQDWFGAVVIVIIGLIVAASLISAYAKENPLFAYMIGGGGVLAAILYGVKRIFYSK
jgi:hypothetical protein